MGGEATSDPSPCQQFYSKGGLTVPLVGDALDACLDGLIAALPAAGKYRLYTSDPTLAGTPADVELDPDGGYAPQNFAPADFAASSGGASSSASPVSWGASTDAYSDVAGYWGITDDVDDSLAYYDELDAPVSVTDAGVTPERTFTILIGESDS
jgi:hypothetical protein